LKIVWTSQFKKDYKRDRKQGRPLKELKRIANQLASGEKLNARHKDHSLKGFGKKAHRECHIKPDWLLIYRIDEDAIMFIRTGTHSDLFR
jgi:mRNA interferase YafQ